MNITPLGVDLTGRRVVAVGGGPVAARRVSAFVDDGADVTVVAPHLCERLRDLVDAGRVTWAERRYAGPADLAGAWLVHTATGDAVIDETVAAHAEAQHTFCINATDASTGTAATPARAVVNTATGSVQVGVHGGGDPQRAAAVRDAVVEVVSTALNSGTVDLRPRRARRRGGLAEAS